MTPWASISYSIPFVAPIALIQPKEVEFMLLIVLLRTLQ